MTDPWTDPADALFTNPDWEDPFPIEEAPWWAFVGVTPAYRAAFDESCWVSMGEPDFYAPRARWVSDR